MRKILILTMIIMSAAQSMASEEVLLKYAYNFPLLICYNDDYRACYSNITVETCALEIKQYREECLNNLADPSSPSAVANLAACLVTSHAGASSFEEITDPCIKVKGMNINITQNTRKIKEADPKWVLKVLE